MGGSGSFHPNSPVSAGDTQLMCKAQTYYHLLHSKQPQVIAVGQRPLLSLPNAPPCRDRCQGQPKVTVQMEAQIIGSMQVWQTQVWGQWDEGWPLLTACYFLVFCWVQSLHLHQKGNTDTRNSGLAWPPPVWGGVHSDSAAPREPSSASHPEPTLTETS